MTFPREYGGTDADALHRFVVTEELLAAGAPVAAHWVADRQSGPVLLRFGTEQQRADFMITLVRTAPREDQDRHAGLGQLIVDLAAPGVQIRPIRLLTVEHHLNEIVLDGVFVPHSRLLGRAGDGWHQVTSELAFERSGPERILSTFPLLAAAAMALAGPSALRRPGSPPTHGWLPRTGPCTR